MSQTLDLLLSRRSVVARKIVEPGPDDDQLELILRAGLRVPDHGKLAPWRFVVIKGAARGRLGEVLANALVRAEPDAKADRVDYERARFTRAPVIVCVVSRARRGKVPRWEQVLSSGAVCQNMLIAVHALGFVGQWLTEWYAYDAAVRAALGLAADERIAGFIYMGSAAEPPEERRRPDLADLVTDLPADLFAAADAPPPPAKDERRRHRSRIRKSV